MKKAKATKVKKEAPELSLPSEEDFDESDLDGDKEGAVTPTIKRAASDRAKSSRRRSKKAVNYDEDQASDTSMVEN